MLSNYEDVLLWEGPDRLPHYPGKPRLTSPAFCQIWRSKRCEFINQLRNLPEQDFLSNYLDNDGRGRRGRCVLLVHRIRMLRFWAAYLFACVLCLASLWGKSSTGAAVVNLGAILTVVIACLASILLIVAKRNGEYINAWSLNRF